MKYCDKMFLNIKTRRTQALWDRGDRDYIKIGISTFQMTAFFKVLLLKRNPKPNISYFESVLNFVLLTQ